MVVLDNTFADVKTVPRSRDPVLAEVSFETFCSKIYTLVAEESKIRAVVADILGKPNIVKDKPYTIYRHFYSGSCKAVFRIELGIYHDDFLVDVSAFKKVTKDGKTDCREAVKEIVNAMHDCVDEFKEQLGVTIRFKYRKK